MILQSFLYTVLGCIVSIMLDWAIFDRFAFILRGEAMPDEFTYGKSSLARKVAIVAIGGIGVPLWNDDVGRVSLVSLWALLHLAIYYEWYRAPK